MNNELTAKDFKLLKQITSLNKKAMLINMASYLKKKYNNNIVATQDYLYATGNIPVALVAHLDTVFPIPTYEVYYDREEQVIWSPQGLGADDRAGILAIIKLVRDGYRPHLVLTMDEELGAIGAGSLVAAHLKHPFPDLKYIIQLDRRGSEDCVFYDCENDLFSMYIESFGFKTAIGTFSDISVICPSWGIAGVNLSVGYYDEHSYVETLHVRDFLTTYNKVRNMLDDVKNIAEPYNYICTKRPFIPKASLNTTGIRCEHCKHLFDEYEVFPVKGKDGSVKFYCPDCMVTHVSWCEKCNEGFEVAPFEPYHPLCPDCRESVAQVKA